jgi:hypothetical protein
MFGGKLEINFIKLGGKFAAKILWLKNIYATV